MMRPQGHWQGQVFFIFFFSFFFSTNDYLLDYLCTQHHHHHPPPSLPKVVHLCQNHMFSTKKQGIYTNCHVFIPSTTSQQKRYVFFHDLYIYPINDFTGELPYHNTNVYVFKISYVTNDICGYYLQQQQDNTATAASLLLSTTTKHQTSKKGQETSTTTSLETQVCFFKYCMFFY